MVPSKPDVRAAALVDAGLIAGAHERCFPDEPWSRESILALLDSSMSFGLIIENTSGNDRTYGFSISRAMAEECEILTFGIVPQCRGQGLGLRLLEATLTKARDFGCSKVFLEVKETNATAIRLYTSCGFDVVGRRNGYYRAKGQGAIDALILAWNTLDG